MESSSTRSRHLHWNYEKLATNIHDLWMLKYRLARIFCNSLSSLAIQSYFWRLSSDRLFSLLKLALTKTHERSIFVKRFFIFTESEVSLHNKILIKAKGVGRCCCWCSFFSFADSQMPLKDENVTQWDDVGRLPEIWRV